MSKTLLRLALLSSPLVLTACGEGWVAQKTDAHIPYGNERTAGSGVAYVLAKMMPEKDLVVEPVMESPEPETTIEPVLEAEEIFSDAQKKGAAPAKKDMGADKQSSLQTIQEEKHVAIVEPAAGVEIIEEEFASFDSLEDVSAPTQAQQITAEDYIAQAPKRIIAKKVEIVKASAPKTMNTNGFEGEEMVEVFENEVIQPQKEIIVPKKDHNAFLSVGEEALDQIYNNDF